jgi:hypothetical protein
LAFLSQVNGTQRRASVEKLWFWVNVLPFSNKKWVNGAATVGMLKQKQNWYHV